MIVHFKLTCCDTYLEESTCISTHEDDMINEQKTIYYQSYIAKKAYGIFFTTTFDLFKKQVIFCKDDEEYWIKNNKNDRAAMEEIAELKEELHKLEKCYNDTNDEIKKIQKNKNIIYKKQTRELWKQYLRSCELAPFEELPILRSQYNENLRSLYTQYKNNLNKLLQDCINKNINNCYRSYN